MKAPLNKKFLKKIYSNFKGWRTNRKIVVIESDDWGSIRMPSKEIYQKCLNAGYRVDNNPYEKYDALASEKDLDILFNLLSDFKDKENRPPIITANCLTSNPDFKKIAGADYQTYYSESILKTFNKYPYHSKCFSMWQKAMQECLFWPQSHGREHLNVSKFMDALLDGDKDVHFAFKNEMPGSIPKNEEFGKNKFIEGTRFTNEEQREQVLTSTLDGLEKFHELFGFKSKSFIPQNYIWSSYFDKPIFNEDVQFYQGIHKMKEPIINDGVSFNKYWLGDKNLLGQCYLIRNASFEPSFFNNKKECLKDCLRDVSIAFRFKKPAIISMHRINLVGYIHKNNREENIEVLSQLLKNIIYRWPDVEFLTSDELGFAIKASNE